MSCGSTAVERLARFKVPKSFTFVDELPRNSMGKIQKSELMGRGATDVIAVVTNVEGLPLSREGAVTRRRLLDAAESVGCDLGFPEASVVKVADAAGRCYRHVLSLLRLEARDLRRADDGPQPPHPPGR